MTWRAPKTLKLLAIYYPILERGRPYICGKRVFCCSAVAEPLWGEFCWITWELGLKYSKAHIKLELNIYTHILFFVVVVVVVAGQLTFLFIHCRDCLIFSFVLRHSLNYSQALRYCNTSTEKNLIVRCVPCSFIKL